MRRIPALIGAAALATVALTACSAPAATGCEYPSGDASSAITADGDLTASDVAFPTPLIASSTEKTVLVEGEGDPIARGAQVDFDYAVFYGATGEMLSADGGTTARAGAALADNAISQALQCATVGERYALATTAADSFGEGALTANGIADDDTLVIVVDVNAVYLGKADGVNQLPKDGMPNVVTEVDGRPGISIISSADAPTETRSETVKAGGGEVVNEGDAVVLQYSLFGWPADGATEPSEISSTWDAGQATTLVAGTLADGGGMPKGLADAVIGAKIGSQLLVVIPPGEDGFSADALPTGVSADSTIIFVVDLLGTVQE